MPMDVLTFAFQNMGAFILWDRFVYSTKCKPNVKLSHERAGTVLFLQVSRDTLLKGLQQYAHKQCMEVLSPHTLVSTGCLERFLEFCQSDRRKTVHFNLHFHTYRWGWTFSFPLLWTSIHFIQLMSSRERATGTLVCWGHNPGLCTHPRAGAGWWQLSHSEIFSSLGNESDLLSFPF